MKYFAAASWTITTPAQNAIIGCQVDVAGTGTGEAEGVTFVLKVEIDEVAIQQGSDEVNSAEEWSKDLSPPSGAPYFGLWPDDNAVVCLYRLNDLKTSADIDFEPEG